MLFSDQVVMVTGGSSGIGLAAALKFAREGARVAILARGEERLKRAAQEIQEASPDARVLPIVSNIRSEQQVQDAFSTVSSSMGPVNVVVNNAGWGINSPFEDTSLEMWQELMDVHCTGYFLVAREAVRTFICQKSGGAIVFVTSDNAIRPSRNLVAYCTAKAAELQMARCIADECGRYGIRVNSVLPGAVFGRSSFWTPEFRAARANIRGFDPNNLEEEYKKNSALGVVIDPDEVADVILFLASEKAAKITGAAVSVDGGGTAAYVR